jgi:hypothetical protein
LGYQFRLRQVQRAFNMRLEERVEERTRIARELHDTLLQSFQWLMFSFQAARNLLPGRTEEAIRTLDGAIRKGDDAIAEGRNALQGLRAHRRWRAIWSICSQPQERNSRDSPGAEAEPVFRVTVEGSRQPLSPLLQDEVYRIRDNGKGIDRAVLEQGARQEHWGLPGVPVDDHVLLRNQPQRGRAGRV